MFLGTADPRPALSRKGRFCNDFCSILQRPASWIASQRPATDAASRKFLRAFSLDLLRSHLYSNGGLTQRISKHGALKEASVGDRPGKGPTGQSKRNC